MMNKAFFFLFSRRVGYARPPGSKGSVVCGAGMDARLSRGIGPTAWSAFRLYDGLKPGGRAVCVFFFILFVFARIPSIGQVSPHLTWKRYDEEGSSKIV